MFDTFSPFALQSLFGHQQPFWPTIGSGLGYPQLTLPQALLACLQGQYAASPFQGIGGTLGQPQHPLFPGLMPQAHLPGQFGPTISGWPGQPSLASQVGGSPFGGSPFGGSGSFGGPAGAGIGPAALSPQIAGWLAQQYLASVLGRTIGPYQSTVPQLMACAGY